MTMANLVPTPDGRFWDPRSGTIYLDQAGMQPDMSGEPLGNFGTPVQGPVQPGQESIVPAPWTAAATNQVQTTDLTPAEMSYMSPEAISRARSETPGMRAFDYYNMMQAAPSVRALGTTGQQIAQQRLPEFQTRFGLGQYFGDMPGQGEDTFRGFVEAQPTAWGGQDWQNAMGGLRTGGMLSQAIEGYADMTPEQQFEQRTKFLGGMGANEKGNLLNLNEKGGREQVVAMIKGMLGGSDLPAGMRGWMDTAIEDEIAKLERDQPDLTTNASNLLLHMSMNGFDLNGLGQPPEQKAISPYTDTKSVQAETNKATASDKAAANVTLENAATPTVENKPAKSTVTPTATEKKIQPVQNPQIKAAIDKSVSGTLTPDDLRTLPTYGPGLGGERDMMTPAERAAADITSGAAPGFTGATTPDTGMLPGLGGDAIPSFTPSAVAQPQPTTPLPGLGGGEFNIPQAMPATPDMTGAQPSIMPATPDMAGVQPTPLGGARTGIPGQLPTEGGFGAAPAGIGDISGMGQIAPGGVLQPFAPTPTNIPAPAMDIPSTGFRGGIGFPGFQTPAMPGITPAPETTWVTPGNVAKSAQNIFAEGQYGRTMEAPSAFTGDIGFSQFGRGEFGGETPGERAATQAQIDAMQNPNQNPQWSTSKTRGVFQDRLYGDLRGNGVQRTPNYGQSILGSTPLPSSPVGQLLGGGQPGTTIGYEDLPQMGREQNGNGWLNVPGQRPGVTGALTGNQRNVQYGDLSPYQAKAIIGQNGQPSAVQTLPGVFNPNAGPEITRGPAVFNPNAGPAIVNALGRGAGPAVTSIGREDYGNPYSPKIIERWL